MKDRRRNVSDVVNCILAGLFLDGLSERVLVANFIVSIKH